MTARPPETPPNSDLDGVNQDRRPIDHPDNAKEDPGKLLKRADDQSRANPPRNDD